MSRPSWPSCRRLWVDPAGLPAMLLAMLLTAPTGAQGLTDPTVPPPEARQVTGTLAPPESKGPQLQSVLVGSNGRQVAVIDGQTVRQGEKFNGALLVKVDKNHAVLRRGDRTQVLTLYPDSAERNARAARRPVTNQPANQPAKQPANND